MLVSASEIGANLRAAASPHTACADHIMACSPFSLQPILMAAHFHRARFSFCRGCEGRRGVRMTSWPRNPLIELSADFAVTPAAQIRRAPNGSALRRSRSSEFPTQPKAWNAPKIRSLRHIQPQGNVRVLRSHWPLAPGYSVPHAHTKPTTRWLLI